VDICWQAIRASDPDPDPDPQEISDKRNAQWMKHVSRIDTETCMRCGGAVRGISGIENPALIERIVALVRGIRR
jgi:hypothetical protein